MDGTWTKLYDRCPSTCHDLSTSHDSLFYLSFCNRSFAQVLSDWPDTHILPQDESDFSEGMKGIYDALHADDDDTMPTFMYPYRGGAFRNLRRNSIEPNLVDEGM